MITQVRSHSGDWRCSSAVVWRATIGKPSLLALCFRHECAGWGAGAGMSDPFPLTEWLRAAGGGDGEAGNRAYAQVYAELRRLAMRQLGRAGGSATLTPTVLV